MTGSIPRFPDSPIQERRHLESCRHTPAPIWTFPLWRRAAGCLRAFRKTGALLGAAVLVSSMIPIAACKGGELEELERQKAEMRTNHDRYDDSDAILMLESLEKMSKIEIFDIELVRDGGSVMVEFHDQSNNRWRISQHHQSTAIRACEMYCDGMNDIVLKHGSRAEENLLKLLGPVSDTNALVEKLIRKCRS